MRGLVACGTGGSEYVAQGPQTQARPLLSPPNSPSMPLLRSAAAGHAAAEGEGMTRTTWACCSTCHGVAAQQHDADPPRSIGAEPEEAVGVVGVGATVVGTRDGEGGHHGEDGEGSHDEDQTCWPCSCFPAHSCLPCHAPPGPLLAGSSALVAPCVCVCVCVCV